MARAAGTRIMPAMAGIDHHQRARGVRRAGNRGQLHRRSGLRQFDADHMIAGNGWNRNG